MLKTCTIFACPNGLLGMHLSRAPWDPYPWVSAVTRGSSAQNAGVRMGDSVLELNERDVLGLRIAEIAANIREHWKTGAAFVTMVIWRNNNRSDGDNQPNNGTQLVIWNEENCDEEQHQGINQQSLQKFATCLQHIAQLLECPVCLEIIRSPGWQCCNGHVMCNSCRDRTVKCPVCRVALGPRGRCLLSDKLFALLAENFPCDGVRNGKNSKCTLDFHTYPMVASMVLKQEEKDIMEQQQRQHRQLLQKKVKETWKKLKSPHLAKVAPTNGDNQADGGATPAAASSATSSVQQGPGQDAAAQRPETKMWMNPNYEKPKRSRDAGQAESIPLPVPVEVVSAGGIRMWQQESSFIANNMLVKLKLKSNRTKMPTPTPTPTDHNGIRAQPHVPGSGGAENAARGRSHELRDDEVAIVNNAMTTNAVQPKSQQEQQEQQQQQQELAHVGGKQQYQNYHCPTGKSCCSDVKTFGTAAVTMTMTIRAVYGNSDKNNNNLPHKKFEKPGTNEAAAQVAAARIETKNDDNAAANEAATNDVAAKEAATNDVATNDGKNVDGLSCNRSSPGVAQQRGTEADGDDVGDGRAQLRNEWQILAHLTQQHRLPVTQLYGTFGQRIHVEFVRGQVLPCLNLQRPSAVASAASPSPGGADKFFVATMPLGGDEYAIFLWHLPADDTRRRRRCNFETIIESKRHAVKWFGRAHSLSRSWTQIHAEGHYLKLAVLSPPPIEAPLELVIKIK